MFEYNLGRLLKLKEEAKRLLYEREKVQKQLIRQLFILNISLNQEQLNRLTYQQIEEITQLRSQSLLLQDHYEQQNNIQKQKIEQLRAEIFLQIQQSDQQTYENNLQIKELQNVIEQLQLQAKDQQQSHNKEIENIKLMHQQELYILRRKK
ncbi:hypothetical protein pb186bvf_017912 [Paramecium bursaria]